MPGRIQFNTLKPETAPWPARFLEWVRQRYRSLMALLGGAEKPVDPATPRESRIRFHDLRNGGSQTDPALVIRDAQVHCPACGLELASQSETAVCTLNSAHVVHARCSVELLKGKCPLDGAAMRATV